MKNKFYPLISIFLLLILSQSLSAQLRYTSKATSLITEWNATSGEKPEKSGTIQIGCRGDEKILFQEEFDGGRIPQGWEVRSSDPAKSWGVTYFPEGDERSFLPYNTEDRGSAVIDYVRQYTFDEWLVTPSVSYTDHPLIARFYLGMDPDFTLSGLEIAFLFSADEGTSWQMLWKATESVIDPNQEFFSWWKIEVPVPEMEEGSRIRFAWHLSGSDGDQVLLDGFRLVAPAKSDQITRYEGDTIAFYSNLAVGEKHIWTFEGGVPSVSDLPCPVVRYEREGIYPVSLRVPGQETQIEKTDYIKILPRRPIAAFEMPAGVYRTLSGNFALPVDQEVTLRDRSACYPRSWLWTLPGSNLLQSAEQHPTLSYPHAGVYDLTLHVENGAGTNEVLCDKGIHVANESYVWNILPDDEVGGFQLFDGYHGYFPGTNFRTYHKYAEYFAKPLRRVSLSEASLFFVANRIAEPQAEVSLSVCRVGSDGFPAEELAAATEKIKNVLLPEGNTLRATTFHFAEPVILNEPFFLVVSGIPNGDNDCVVFSSAMPREEGGTAFICHNNWDPYTGNVDEKARWDRTEDIELLRKSTSFAILAKMDYEKDATSLDEVSDAYPNLFTGEIKNGFLSYRLHHPVVSLRVSTIQGVVVLEQGESHAGSYEHPLPCASGIYLITIQTEESLHSFKLIE
ncbi:MAG: choice-of-anchor J domain-containing protein [Bacteroidales bacterium]